MFSVLTGAIIWVRFEEQADMIDGENEGPATGSRRPREGRFRHLRRPGCGVPARPVTISNRVRRLDAAPGVSVQSMDCLRLPLWASGGIPAARITDGLITKWKIGLILYPVKRKLLLLSQGRLRGWVAPRALAGGDEGGK